MLGVLVSLSSVGAGALGLTALVFLYPKQPIARLVGSDIAHAVPLTLIAGIGHWWLGSTNWALLGALLIGSLPGIVIGSLIATRIPDAALRPVLAAVLLLVGSRMLAQ
ncbi:MAG: sulfite exporter TauE/SafE family protein [Aliidongia sp.]